MAVPESSKSGKDQQLQIRLKTIHSEYAVPDSPLSIPVSVDTDSLNNLIKSLLGNDDVPTFDFIIADDLLRSTFDVFLQGRDDISREVVIDVLYIEQQSPPKPKKNVNHEDWVAGVSALGNFIVSGCYDNTVTIWSNSEKEAGQKLLTVPGHVGPVRAVTWISLDEDFGTFASASHDQVKPLMKSCESVYFKLKL